MATRVSNTTTVLGKTDFEDISELVNLSRAERGSIAEDTLNKLNAGWYDSYEGFRINLVDDVTFCKTNSVLYTEDDLQNRKKIISTIDEIDSTSLTTTTNSRAKIEVRHCTTLQAARSLVAEVEDENRVGVLNFASAKNPGGGFLRGAQAQEESIARSSSLYLALTQPRFFDGYYGYNRRRKRGIYSHRMIYSPRVTVFKDDNGKILSAPYHVGIVTVPAPNAGVLKDPEAITDAMTERIKRLLYVFEANKHDSLVLGAFGCGVFRNSPLDVAIIFRQHLESKEFQNSFKRIIFAVLDADMYQVFEEVFTATNVSDIQHQMTTLSVTAGDNKQYSRTHQNKQHKKKGKQKRIRDNHFEHLADRTGDDDDDDD